jgi:hypothetical protein
MHNVCELAVAIVLHGQPATAGAIARFRRQALNKELDSVKHGKPATAGFLANPEGLRDA